jgi:L-ascorbate metabolism protein UlaG (beta-lactamase superfamily)
VALTRRSFLQSTTSAVASLAIPARVSQQNAAPPDSAGGPGSPGNNVRVQLIRNATCLIRYGGKTLLLDPFLSDAGVLPAFNNSPNPRPNPLVPLPVPAAQIVTGIDAVFVTHTHVDHWDPAARDLLPKGPGIPLFVQPANAAQMTQAGFSVVRTVDTTLQWDGMSITRTGGQHGSGDTGRRMGAVSGYVLERAGLPTVYLAGDTIWCPEVADALRTHRPDIIMVNAGAAQFLEGGPITMDVDDVVKVCAASPQATVIAVHMEAVNHCVLTRDGLRAGLTRAAVTTKVLIPRDGEDIRLA